MNSLGAAWPMKEWERAAEEARGAIRRGAHLPKAKGPSRDVLGWKARTVALHRALAGGKGKEINRVALASVLRRVR